ncbi:amino acid permease/ SLC12A domain-containing protein [Tricharina praecox]|uniref:amino acid permease/ SLC12A domain-containing protein n=1 Tax=Tricharina praecox TaxID=43433 RepID=UPI0022207562|nr:amino acid permease/ SLC12A domain-containing protein [Tricharina praecox]KAI5852023.1 amino acid permease/ SLC12A domain-containing protein [Tricharina praecox]
MSSTGHDFPGGAEKKEKEEKQDEFADEASLPPSKYDNTHRKLKSRHIQLIGIGGTIGTALYVQIGRALMKGGPANLFIAFTFWCSVILCINNSLSEMVTYMPISSPFVRFAGRFVDESFGVAAGWNFFIFEAAMVPFEIVACTQILGYWGTSEKVHVGVIIAICIALYAGINLIVVKFYGESEFWLALGKLILIIGLIAFTFITMVGGNPQRDAYGFRYWKNPGAFAEHYSTGDLGRFMGFVACLIQASFTIAGPDYVAISAGEAENARVVMPRAFKAVTYRLVGFFVLGSLAVGIVVPHNDPVMRRAFLEGAPDAAASPYVVAMDRLQIPFLPHIVNALVLTSAFSAGNSYVYCASRCLFGLALDGQAPKIFARCTRSGVPIYSVLVVLAIAMLAFLQVSNSASVVLSWFVSLVTASQLINFSVILYTYLRFRRALAAQGTPMSALPYMTRWQPYTTYFALTCTLVMCFVSGYEVFLPGNWNIPTFLFSYTMIAVFPLIWVAWKTLKRTSRVPLEEVNTFREEREVIDEYQRNYVAPKPR